MIVSLDHTTWQILRQAVRSEAAGEFPTGRDLRVNPTRKTKDGTFLDRLVADGFLAVAEKPKPLPATASAAERAAPAQFRTRYKLTDKGRGAAEYGEYDRPHTPEPTPLTGTAAELFAGRASGKKGASKKPRR